MANFKGNEGIWFEDVFGGDEACYGVIKLEP